MVWLESLDVVNLPSEELLSILSLIHIFPEAGTDGNGDRLIGAFITSEYLDLYDMEGYLNDHAASLMNNSSITCLLYTSYGYVLVPHFFA